MNRKAFLYTLAVSEIGVPMLAKSDDGYNVLVGSTPSAMSTFDSYADHPRKLVHVGGNLWSTAAGRYQILSHLFDAYKAQLSLPDFGKDSQDAIALQLARECHALDDIDAGRIEMALTKCRSRWASLPGAGYGQHENSMAALVAAYQSAGGKLA
jgi:muramidase (phage lysozyme)